MFDNEILILFIVILITFVWLVILTCMIANKKTCGCKKKPIPLDPAVPPVPPVTGSSHADM